MARPSDWILLPDVKLSVDLDRYQELMRLPPAAFNGLLRENDIREYDCEHIWNQSDRDNLAMNLAQAQEIREQELGYYLAPIYVDETFLYSNPVVLRRKHLIEIGEEITEDVEDGVSLTLSNGGIIDPVEFTVTVDFTDADELVVCYPDEDVEINTQSVTISGTTATVTILRSRLKKHSLDINYYDSEFPRYDDDANFLTTVDIKRRYYQNETGAYFVWMPGNCSVTVQTTQQAQSVIDDYRRSVVNMYPGLYANGAWTYKPLTKNYLPTHINLRYVSGRQRSMNTEMLTARLSHVQPAKLSPCSICYEGDIKVHESGATTPYGNSVAAVEVWMSDSRAKVGHGGMFV